jgi:hypothetical protein
MENASVPPTQAGSGPSSFLTQSRVRHEWFQNENYVTVSIFIKNVKNETVSVYFADRSLSVTIKMPTGSDYSLELDPLAHEILPAECKYEVLSTKIEIKLKKQQVGVKWGVLEGEDSLAGSLSVSGGEYVLAFTYVYHVRWLTRFAMIQTRYRTHHPQRSAQIGTSLPRRSNRTNPRVNKR